MMTLVRASVAKLCNAELQPFLAEEHVMSMPALRHRVWSVEEVERLADERPGLTPRYELVDGELLVTPAPSDRHQRIVAELFVLVREYANRNAIGEARLGPGLARLTPDSRFEPDLFVVSNVDGRRPRADDSLTRLLVVAEVLSPGSGRHDRITKRRFFQRHGVPDYWVIDGDAGTFEIWRPDDERAALVDDRLVWLPEGARVPFELDVSAFFASVSDDA
jgi:Uma2 family endonuclease